MSAKRGVFGDLSRPLATMKKVAKLKLTVYQGRVEAVDGCSKKRQY